MELINRSSLVEISESLRSDNVSLIDNLNSFFERFDRIEPIIHAFVEQEDMKGRLLAEAVDLMERFPNPMERPPLYGIPVGIKDIIHADGFLTRAGSTLPLNILTSTEATIVTILRSNGALLAGKTTTEEFAYSSITPTRNPHNIKHSPGGSSAGSAAAVAAGLCPLAIGTQTLLSVIAPASFCGVVGFKPSYSRISTTGTILLSPSFDTIGLFTQNVLSMQFASSTLIPDWKPAMPLTKPVLGIPKGIYLTMLYEGTMSVFEKQIDTLKQNGYTVLSVDMPWEDSFIYGNSMLKLVQAEMAAIHEEWYENHRDLYGSRNRDGIESGQKITPEELHQFREGQLPLRKKLEQTMLQHGIDLWVSPAQAGPAPEGFNQSGRGGMTSIWTYAGVPTISIPGATMNGMPIGFQCISAYGNDESLLSWAEEIETILA